MVFVSLVALYLVWKLRKQLQTAGDECYRNLATGLVVLAMVSLANLYHNEGMFNSVPFLSVPLFFDLVSWIGLITGATFVLSAVSAWVPLARNHQKYNQGRIAHLDLLRKVEQLIGVDSRLDVILGTVLHYMAEGYDLSFGAVYKYSPRRKKLYLTATTDDVSSEARELCQATLDEGKLHLLTEGIHVNPVDLFVGLPRRLNRPKLILPIMVGDQAAGFFLLWTDGRTDQLRDEELILRLAVDIIARKIETDRSALETTAVDSRHRWRDRLTAQINSSSLSKDGFAGLIDRISQEMPIDYAALAVIEEDGTRMQRLSTGRNRQVLVESGLSLPARGSLTGPAYRTNLQVVAGNLQADRQISTNEILTGGDVSSVVALPIEVDGRNRAVLTLASCKKRAFASGELEIIDYLHPVLVSLAIRSMAQNSRGRHLSRMEKLSRFSSRLNRPERTGNICDEVTNLLLDELGFDMARIVTLDDDGKFLKSHSFVSRQPVAGVVPGDGQLILSLMPLHEKVLKDAVYQYVSEGGSGIAVTDIEARQAFVSGVKSALIVPLISGNRVLGTISLARAAESSVTDIDPAALAFIKTIATMLATQFDTDRVTATADEKTTAGNVTVAGDLRNRLKSSLTGILGSVELLRAHPSGTDEQVNRYLSIIDRSARKLDNCLNEETVNQP